MQAVCIKTDDEASASVSSVHSTLRSRPSHACTVHRCCCDLLRGDRVKGLLVKVVYRYRSTYCQSLQTHLYQQLDGWMWKSPFPLSSLSSSLSALIHVQAHRLVRTRIHAQMYTPMYTHTHTDTHKTQTYAMQGPHKHMVIYTCAQKDKSQRKWFLFCKVTCEWSATVSAHSTRGGQSFTWTTVREITFQVLASALPRSDSFLKLGTSSSAGKPHPPKVGLFRLVI